MAGRSQPRHCVGGAREKYPQMTQVKICGLKDRSNLAVALDAGADFVGFVIFPKSPRHVSVTEAAELVREVRRQREDGKTRAESVVLLVDPDDALVRQVANEVKPDIIQLHGTESVERTGKIRALSGCRIMKAVRVAAGADVERAEAYLAPMIADLVLFDAKAPETPGSLPGGNGLSFDWRILDQVRERYPFALAGGLTPENAEDAARLTAAAMLDVSSGVEKSPGEKDPALIRRFLQAAKAANRG